MKTEFALLACYEKVLLPLELFAEEIMGISLSTARNQISNGTFPVPLTPMGSKKMIHVADAAAYIDSQRGKAA